MMEASRSKNGATSRITKGEACRGCSGIVNRQSLAERSLLSYIAKCSPWVPTTGIGTAVIRVQPSDDVPSGCYEQNSSRVSRSSSTRCCQCHHEKQQMCRIHPHYSAVYNLLTDKIIASLWSDVARHHSSQVLCHPQQRLTCIGLIS